MPARPHLLTSVFTHWDHVFLGLPFPGTRNRKVCYRFETGRGHYTWPNHVSGWQRRTDVISSMESFCSSETEGVFLSVFDAADPRDHGTVFVVELLQFGVIWSPHFTTMPRKCRPRTPCHVHLATYPGGRINIKMPSYQYRKSHCGDKTVVRSSYLHNGISYTGKMASLYWIGALGERGLVVRTSKNFLNCPNPDSKVHGANMGPTWVLLAPEFPCTKASYVEFPCFLWSASE